MNKKPNEEQQEDFNKRVQELFAFAKEKEIFVGAVQKLSKEGYLETIPLFRDLKSHKEEPQTSSPTTGTPTPDEFLPE